MHQILRERARRAEAGDNFLQIRRLTRGQFFQLEQRRRAISFPARRHDLPQHAERIRQPAQGPPIEKRARGQFVTAALEGPEAGEQVAAVHGRDIAWMQRLEIRQVVPIEEMTFETLESAQRLEGAEVARHEVVAGDVAKIVRRHRRQHPETDVGRGGAQENFTLSGFPERCPAGARTFAGRRTHRNIARCAARWCGESGDHPASKFRRASSSPGG